MLVTPLVHVSNEATESPNSPLHAGNLVLFNLLIGNQKNTSPLVKAPEEQVAGALPDPPHTPDVS